MGSQGVEIGPVYRDPRGKVGRDGAQEHLFIVRTGGPGGFVEFKRHPDRETADVAREALVEAVTA